MPVRQLACVTLALGAGGVALAQQNNQVRGDLVSHVAWADRTPRAPIGQQAFSIRFQTGHFDVVSARVGIDHGADGGAIEWVDAQFASTTGPTDEWVADLPATFETRYAYVIEVTDGTDTDYYSAAGHSETMPATGSWFTLDYQTLEHAPYGSTPTTGGTVFRVWAPGAPNAYVRGDFNNFTLAHEMVRFEDDYILYVPGADVGDDYKFWFNGKWASDARGRWMNNNDSFNTKIVDPDAFEWRFPNFTPAPAEEWVIYQLHVGTFAGRNDPFGGAPSVSRYVDVIPRIPHLVELGVNCVMLNPINEFPGAVSGGYNSITPYAIESSYGTPDELRAMVDALHGAGIAVILDMVWNHVPSNDNLLWNYDGTQHFFDTPNVDTPWGAQADFDDPDVLKYYEESVETIIGEYKMDGFRHDAVFELVSAVQPVAGQALVRNTMDEMRRRFPDTHVIGEIYNNDPWNTAPFGIRMDAQYHEAFKNAILDAVNAAGLGDPDMWRLANSIDGSGVYVNGDRVMNYFELHDDAWPLNNRQRSVRDIDTTFPHDDRFALGRTKLGNGLTIMAQGIPAILMGTEWAEDSGWETSKIDWFHKTRYRGVFDFYRDVIDLRTSKRALFANSPAFITQVNDSANVLAFERTGADGRSYMVVANFSNTDFQSYTIGMPRGGEWGLILNSEDARYMGTGFGGSPRAIAVSDADADGLPYSASLQLPAHGMLVLQHEPEYIEGDTVFALFDINEDGEVSYDDLYAYFDVLPDLTGDGLNDDDDRDAISGALLEGALDDALDGR